MEFNVVSIKLIYIREWPKNQEYKGKYFQLVKIN